MSKIAALSLLLCAGIAGAQERASQFAHGAGITVEGSESHYRFALPAAAYMGIARRDLGDVRVFNGVGEAVPYAFVPLKPKTIAPDVRPARLYPLYGEENKGLDGVGMRLEQTARGTVVHVDSRSGLRPAARKLLGYLVDAGEDPPPLAALVLDWQVREGFTGFARVEASEDLKHWRPLVEAAPVVFLEHEGTRLEQKRIEVSSAKRRYLRLSFTSVPSDFALKQVGLELRSDLRQPDRDWLGTPGTLDARRPGEYVFDTGGHFPVDRLRFSLPQPNTVAQAQMLVRDRPEDAWQPVITAMLYRLRRDSRDIVNPEVVVPADTRRYWLLKVDQRGGGLGAGEVRLEFGWIPHELVFAARGTSPFSLAYGMKTAKPSAMPIAAVVPGYKSDEPLAARVVTVSVEALRGREQPSFLKDPVSFARAAVESGEAKKWALWAALVAGVLILGWMAFALLRQLGKPGQDPDSR